MKKTEEPEEPNSDERLVRNMTSLSPDAIHWMNKRRPLNQAVAKPQHISPHRAAQLRDIFNGLDFDGGGEIDLKEFKEAIAYVEAHTKGPSIFGDPKKVKEIFMEMDADGSGTVDFDEFVTALTSDSKSGTNTGNELSKLQHTFYEFANMHRRQNVLDKIADKKLEDPNRFKEFDRLFRMEYFVDGDDELTLEEKLGKANMEAQRDKKRMKHVYQSRKLEAARARAADLMLRSERGSTGSLLRKEALASSHSIADINQLSASFKRRQMFCKRMSPFGIKKQTYVPGIADGTRKYQLRAIEDLNLEKTNRITRLPPAESVRVMWERKEKEFVEAKQEL